MSKPLRRQVYLNAYLAPFADLLARQDVTDVYVNRPREIWAESTGGAIERFESPELDEATLDRLSRQIASLAHQGISREHPLLSATLPDGARVQVIASPATRNGVALAIRKHVFSNLRLADYTNSGAFADTATSATNVSNANKEIDQALALGDIAAALAIGVRARKNILVAGGTSTGKTTFLNALIAEISADERLIFIEDTPELQMQHPNAVGLLAARSELGEARVSVNDLVAASLRMRPDRIILGELRGTEALAFLRAVNTGHPGSMTTVHADSPKGAIEQITLLALQSGTQLSRADVHHYVRSTIDLYVQLGRSGGRRYVSQIVRSNTLDEAS